MKRSTLRMIEDPAYELWRVVLPYACFGLLVRDGIICYGAGIAHWAEGRPLDGYIAWLHRKGGTISRL